MNISKLFNKPKVIAVIGDVNSGKSMLLYHLLHSLSKTTKFKLFTYGLRTPIKNAQEIFSVAEMEKVRNSLILIDELSSLWDLDNRKNKQVVENSLRLINHNNNILVICGTPENFKKFISGKVDAVIYKTITIADFINGSRMKHLLTNYRGNERGSEMLNLPVDEALCYDGQHYNKLDIPYYKRFDSKKNNVPIFTKKPIRKLSVPKNVSRNVERIKSDKNEVKQNE